MQRNGHVSRALDRLEECGLITADAESNPETGETAREKIYRLSDNHARFYLRYVEPLRESIDRDAYEFISLDALPGWETSMGLAFENLVVNNFRSLAKFLHLGKAPILYAAPFRKRPSKGTGGEGLQIDLLVRIHYDPRARIGKFAILGNGEQFRIDNVMTAYDSETRLRYTELTLSRLEDFYELAEAE